MDIECTVCGHTEEVPHNFNKCEDCKFLHTGKSDDGRFYSCDNKDYFDITKNYTVAPNFGCAFFEKP